MGESCCCETAACACGGPVYSEYGAEDCAEEEGGVSISWGSG